MTNCSRYSFSVRLSSYSDWVRWFSMSVMITATLSYTYGSNRRLSLVPGKLNNIGSALTILRMKMHTKLMHELVTVVIIPAVELIMSLSLCSNKMLITSR